jgi:hypothetical protein
MIYNVWRALDSFTMALPRSLISLTKSHKKSDMCVCWGEGGGGCCKKAGRFSTFEVIVKIYISAP